VACADREFTVYQPNKKIGVELIKMAESFTAEEGLGRLYLFRKHAIYCH
jgi:hypothetical protein